jgi:predicted RNA-binding protein Jag
MADPASSIEVNVEPDEVEAIVAAICADWGVARDAVTVDILNAPADPAEAMMPGGTVRLRITRRTSGSDLAEAASDDDMFADPGDLPSGVSYDDPDLDRAQQVVAELMSLMQVRADVHASWGPEDEGSRPIMLDVRGEDLGVLIGRKGETLAALQYITRLILSKQVGAGVDVVVDVEGTKRRREEQLRRVARRMAEQALQRKRTMTLEAMPPNERRIIHLELRDFEGVTTESVGDGTQRKVTIIPNAS